MDIDQISNDLKKVFNKLERKFLGGDSKFFENNGKKGEVFELNQDLHSLDRTVSLNAVKRVIALMTIGVDVSQLFPDMLSIMQPDNIELKKLIYLYKLCS